MFLCHNINTILVFRWFLDLHWNFGNIKKKPSKDLETRISKDFDLSAYQMTILVYINTRMDCYKVAFLNLDCKEDRLVQATTLD